ncbi:MAG: dual specificity protein phosphatase family protein [Candidatus Odinarchaeota archaeon]
MIKRLNFSWIIPNQLATSALPRCRTDLEWLIITQKVKCLISLNETPLSKYIKHFNQLKSELGFTHHHIPTPDGTGFFLHQYRKMVDLFIQQENKPMLIHCTGGYGRTSTALVAIWMNICQLPLTRAIAELKKIRPQIMLTDIQIDSLRKWEEVLLSPQSHENEDLH